MSVDMRILNLGRYWFAWVHFFGVRSVRKVGVVMLALTAIGLGGCRQQGAETQAAGRQAAGSMAIPVTVGKVEEKAVPVRIQAIGNVIAYSTVSIKPQVSGPLTEVHFKEGDDVRKGQLLFSIDPRPFQAALTQAEAQLAKDKAVAENDRVQAKRYLELYQQGIVPRQQSDDFAAAAGAQDAQVRADEAAIQTMQLNLEYCSIYSPIDGRTGSLQVHVGNLVKANDVPVLVVINQIQPIYADFAIPEQQLAEVKRFRESGQLRVEAEIPNDSGPPEIGTLSFIDNTVDPQTGTIHLKGLFGNPRRRLWPGQFVNVMLTLAVNRNTVVVPSKAISSGQNGDYVYVVKSDNTVESRTVVPGTTFQGYTVVEKGLTPGETVVTDGQVRLSPGARITVKSAAEAPGTSPSADYSTP
jgi:multidrug efflux system membrane fusion protein